MSFYIRGSVIFHFYPSSNLCPIEPQKKKNLDNLVQKINHQLKTGAVHFMVR